ncbi:MAG: DNA methyltransferase [Sphingomonas pseudosanguinis]|uniref:DNA methyltransferase n=1 Tax=Sphingomonas pseudosanguinis TaxID=413712 RepID=UPI00391A8B63
MTDAVYLRKEVIGNATLYLGDCRDVLPTLATGSYSACLTDSPYGDDYRSGFATAALWSEGNIRNDRDNSVRNQVLQLVGDVPTLCFGKWSKESPPGTRMVLIWDKGGALGMGDLRLPWKPDHEEIYVLGDPNRFAGRRDCGSVIYCPPIQSMAKNGRRHPNEKPVALLCKLIDKLPLGAVIDPFMGSGSTLEAAMRLGRPSIGIESDPIYFGRACERIKCAHRQGRLL